MPFGKHEGTAIEKVPSIYLARLYKSNPDMMDKHPVIKQYIETNFSFLLFINKPIGPICDTFKVAFLDNNSAKAALKRIKRDPDQRNTTPVRYYECERCGFWHLTSRER